MSQADFVYAPTEDSAGMSIGVSVFADCEIVRREWSDDARASGLSLRHASPVAELLNEEPRALGEIVLVDCTEIDAARFAALTRLDMRAARSGAQLVVATDGASLDDVFACLDQSSPQILVNPTRAERVIALGAMLARMPNMRLRELPEEDRLMLLRLTEQVGKIAERLERIGKDGAAQRSAFRFGSPLRAFAVQQEEPGDRLVRRPRPPLPDPRLVRKIIRQRQLRAQFFGDELFADPAWDMLLDLTAARVEHARVSVTSLCIASGVPPTTALRWIASMTEAGLFERVADDTDKRRVFIQLSDSAADAMARYFAELGEEALQLA